MVASRYSPPSDAARFLGNVARTRRVRTSAHGPGPRYHSPTAKRPCPAPPRWPEHAVAAEIVRLAADGTSADGGHAGPTRFSQPRAAVPRFDTASKRAAAKSDGRRRLNRVSRCWEIAVGWDQRTQSHQYGGKRMVGPRFACPTLRLFVSQNPARLFSHAAAEAEDAAFAGFQRTG